MGILETNGQPRQKCASSDDVVAVRSRWAAQAALASQIASKTDIGEKGSIIFRLENLHLLIHFIGIRSILLG